MFRLNVQNPPEKPYWDLQGNQRTPNLQAKNKMPPPPCRDDTSQQLVCRPQNGQRKIWKLKLLQLMEEVLHQLRLVVYPIIYEVVYFPGGWTPDFWTINSMFSWHTISQELVLFWGPGGFGILDDNNNNNNNNNQKFTPVLSWYFYRLKS